MISHTVDLSKDYTIDEYIRIDELTERHEFHYGRLIAIPSESLLHNEICLKVLAGLHRVLKPTGFHIYIENVKVSVNEKTYLYPDIVVMKEQPSTSLPYKNYIIYSPLLIVEVLSDSTRKYDLTDKFIQYQKISSLQYYLAVEPQKNLVIFYEKDDTDNWIAKTHSAPADVIQLPKLQTAIMLDDIYAGQ